MNKFLFFTALLMIQLISSCSDDDDATRDDESANLNALLVEIQEMASSVDCTDASDWTYTAYGNKACGGPVGYIAYSTNMDTARFLEKVAQHRRAQEAFNEKWDVISDCSLPGEPSSVRCEDGAPVFEY